MATLPPGYSYASGFWYTPDGTGQFYGNVGGTAVPVVAGSVNAYSMPAPTGGNDDALFAAAIASGKANIQLQSGQTYLLGATFVITASNVVFSASGRDYAVVKAANGTNTHAADSLFDFAARVHDVVFDGLKMDGNRANRTGGNAFGRAVSCATGSNNNYNIKIRRCWITSCGITSMAFQFGAASGNEISDCLIEDIGLGILQVSSGASGVAIKNNVLRDWGKLNADTDAILFFAPSSGIVQNNVVQNTSSTKFFLECVPSGTDAFGTFMVTGNYLDAGNPPSPGYGGGLGGTGISLQCANTLIADNLFVNGDGNGLASRTGIECSAQHTTIKDNVIVGGKIFIGANNISGSNNNVIIQSNNITLNSNLLGGFNGVIGTGRCEDLLVANNSVQVTANIASGNPIAIMLGGYGSLGATSNNRNLVKGNIVRVINGAASAGIAIALNNSCTFNDVRIEGNMVSAPYGISTGTAATISNVKVLSNDATQCANGINGSPAGGGYIEAANVVAPNQTTLAWDTTQALAPAAGGTATVDCRLGLTALVTLPAGNITIGLPSNPKPGMLLTFLLTQDGTGGRTVAWNAIFKKAADGPGTANQKGATSYRYDGANWMQVGGPLSYY